MMLRRIFRSFIPSRVLEKQLKEAEKLFTEISEEYFNTFLRETKHPNHSCKERSNGLRQ